MPLMDCVSERSSQFPVCIFAYWLVLFHEHFDLLIRFPVFSVTGLMTHVLLTLPRVWELVRIPFFLSLQNPHGKSIINNPAHCTILFSTPGGSLMTLEAGSYFTQNNRKRSLHCSSPHLPESLCSILSNICLLQKPANLHFFPSMGLFSHASLNKGNYSVKYVLR